MWLEKILQSQGFGSRKYCQQLIKSGAISINHEICVDTKAKFDLKNFTFKVHGEEFEYREKVYIALNKPQGYECSHQAQYHFSVFDLFDPTLLNRGIQCVGRLDQDTTGLLLLTDDGQFLQALTHPRKHVAKVYELITANPITPEQIRLLEQGVELRNDGIFKASNIKQTSSNQLSLAIHQGVYHQVKRMLAAVGNKVEKLHRSKIGELELPMLAEGEWTYLDQTQIELAKSRMVP